MYLRGTPSPYAWAVPCTGVLREHGYGTRLKGSSKLWTPQDPRLWAEWDP